MADSSADRRTGAAGRAGSQRKTAAASAAASAASAAAAGSSAGRRIKCREEEDHTFREQEGGLYSAALRRVQAGRAMAQPNPSFARQLAGGWAHLVVQSQHTCTTQPAAGQSK